MTYRTKDFLSKNALALKAEVLVMVISKSDAQAFADNELSDDELVKKALVLFCKAIGISFLSFISEFENLLRPSEKK